MRHVSLARLCPAVLGGVVLLHFAVAAEPPKGPEPQPADDRKKADGAKPAKANVFVYPEKLTAKDKLVDGPSTFLYLDVKRALETVSQFPMFTPSIGHPASTRE